MSTNDSDVWPRQPPATRALSWLLNPGGAPSLARLRRAVEGKTILVTGASFGIGEACARLFAATGARVLLVAQSREQLELIAESIRAGGGQADVYPTDLTDMTAVADLGKRLL